MAVSSESEAFRRSLPTLKRAINNPFEVAIDSFSAGVIADKALEQVSMPMPTIQKASVLLSIVNHSIAVRPEVFHQFVTILKNYPYLQDIATQVEHNFRDCQNQEATHAPTAGISVSTYSPYLQQGAPMLPQAPFGAWSLPRFSQGATPSYLTECTDMGLPQAKVPRLETGASSMETQEDSILTEDDMYDVYSEVIPLAGTWHSFGCALRLQQSDLSTIAATYPSNPEACLKQVITKWLQKVYNVKRYGPPTWEKVVVAVLDRAGGNNPDLANRISMKYIAGDSSSHPSDHTSLELPPAKFQRLETDATSSGDDVLNLVPAMAIPLETGNPLAEAGNALKSTYLLKPEIPVDCWPPVKKTHYINLAILSSDPADLKDSFVRHTLRGTLDDILKDKEQIEFSEVFPESDVPLGSRIILQGRPGSGKTTLMNKITQEWSKGKILNNIKVLFLVPLRSLYGKDDISLKDILQTCVGPDKVETLYQSIYKCQGSSVCFAIDGLDEYSPSSKKQDFIHELIRGYQLPQSIVIVASRPAATQKFRRLATRNIEVLGFLQPQISSYVSDYYATDSSKAKELMAFLENHPNVHHMCYLPLHAAMIACLFDRMGSSLPDTETEIYRHFTLYTLIRSLSQLEDRVRSDSDVYLENFEALPSEHYGVFTEICQLAFNATIEKKQIFNQCEVRDSFQLRKGLDTERSLGLIRIDRHQLLYGHTDTYSFLHLTFQEFLAAVHMTRLGVEEQTRCIENHSKEQHMNVVWKFFCGLTKLSDERTMRCFSKILEHSANSLLHMHCAYESQSEIACNTLVSTNSGAVKVHKETLNPSDLSAIMFVVLKAQEPLKEISLTSCHIGQEGVHAAINPIPGSIVQLRELNFGGTKFSNEPCLGFATFLEKFRCCELSFENCGLPLRGFSELLMKIPPAVQVLRLQRNSLGVKAGQTILQQVDCLSELQEMEVDTGFLNGSDFSALLSSCPTLTTMRLWNKKLVAEIVRQADCGDIRIHKENLAELNSRSCGHSLTQLLKYSTGFQRSKFTLSDSEEQLKSIAVKEINCSGCGLSGPDVVNVAGLLKLFPEIQNLDLRENKIGPQGAASLATALPSLEALQKLDLNSNEIDPQGAASLATALPSLEALHELELGWNKLGDEGVISLCEGLKSCTSLQKLSLKGNNIGPQGAASLATALPSLEALQKLDFNVNSIGPQGAASLATALPSLKALQELHLRKNKIGPQGAASLATALPSLEALQELDLLDNGIGPQGAASLATALPSLKALQKLNLYSNEIGPQGAASLATALPSLEALHELDLCGNQLGDEGVISLCEALKSCTSLQTLSLRVNRLTDGSVDRLTFLLRTVKSLTYLDVRINNFTESGEAALRQAVGERKGMEGFAEVHLYI